MGYRLHYYLFTPRSRVLLGKLTGSRLAKKLFEFYGTRMFITAFTSPSHHDVARPHVADGGTASNMEGSCECIK